MWSFVLLGMYDGFHKIKRRMSLMPRESNWKINNLVIKYKILNPLQLSTITHQKNSPYSIAVKRNDEIISNDLIRTYYVKEYEKLIH